MIARVINPGNTLLNALGIPLIIVGGFQYLSLVDRERRCIHKRIVMVAQNGASSGLNNIFFKTYSIEQDD